MKTILEIETDKLTCPSYEEIYYRDIVSKPYIDMVVGIVKSSIDKCEEMTFSEDLFNTDRREYTFSKAMFEIAKMYSDNPDVRVDYQKPEIDGRVVTKFVVKNIRIKTEKELKAHEVKELNNQINEMKTNMNRLLKQINKGSEN